MQGSIEGHKDEIRKPRRVLRFLAFFFAPWRLCANHPGKSLPSSLFAVALDGLVFAAMLLFLLDT
jgi:hypothetical protein